MGGCRAKNKEANVRDTVLAYSYVLFQFYFPYYVLNKVFLCILLLSSISPCQHTR